MEWAHCLPRYNYGSHKPSSTRGCFVMSPLWLGAPECSEEKMLLSKSFLEKGRFYTLSEVFRQNFYVFQEKIFKGLDDFFPTKCKMYVWLTCLPLDEEQLTAASLNFSMGDVQDCLHAVDETVPNRGYIPPYCGTVVSVIQLMSFLLSTCRTA